MSVFLSGEFAALSCRREIDISTGTSSYLLAQKRRRYVRTSRRSCLRCIMNATSRQRNGDSTRAEKFACFSSLFFSASPVACACACVCVCIFFYIYILFQITMSRRVGFGRLAAKRSCSNINTENRGYSQILLGFVTLVAEFTRLPRDYITRSYYARSRSSPRGHPIFISSNHGYHGLIKRIH
ncbi:hypothetical protein PUN28_013396 [Cardiocondyla obscurior]|uniref:Uncharacterized protein n=1 Tax=Cardiocondyla obscurior TaxID=286306 RepID=A0AAW2FC58_9HYME